MVKTVKWVALGLAGAVAFIVKFMPGKKLSKSSEWMPLLRHLATHTSSPIPELARQAKMSDEDALRQLAALEKRGLVKLSDDKGQANVRIAAITKAGREQVA
jgi:DNA-binding MarR family transcriptional regulator